VQNTAFSYIHTQRKDSRTLNGAAPDTDHEQLVTGKRTLKLIKFERNGERGGGKKKRVNPPIDAIKDRLIGGFVGKSKI
ncbi:hypothetical protein, partial [Pseudomonas amygdali]|uniref:hypothetical protein n=2 Tax=Pseudomonas amygdali TaxID=47877 RepID=UPI00160522E2